MAILAHIISGVSSRLVLRLTNSLLRERKGNVPRRSILKVIYARLVYRYADTCVGVSRDVTDDYVKVTGLSGN